MKISWIDEQIEYHENDPVDLSVGRGLRGEFGRPSFGAVPAL